MAKLVADGMTPTEYADDKIVTWLRVLHSELEKDNPDQLSPQHLRRATNRVARIHNRVLEDSGLDGLALPIRIN